MGQIARSRQRVISSPSGPIQTYSNSSLAGVAAKLTVRPAHTPSGTLNRAGGVSPADTNTSNSNRIGSKQPELGSATRAAYRPASSAVTLVSGQSGLFLQARISSPSPSNHSISALLLTFARRSTAFSPSQSSNERFWAVGTLPLSPKTAIRLMEIVSLAACVPPKTLTIN